MKETKFYILIPVYNVEQYLDACLKSILTQNYSEYEIILVNDGSKDSSGEICDRYALENKCVHVVHKENGGQISARLAAVNYVIQNCEYKDSYSIFVDSDDELKAGALATINKKILASSCDMLIYGYEKFSLDESICYTTLEEKNDEMLIDDVGDLLREAVIKNCYNSLCRKAVRTEMLSREMDNRFNGIQMGEDLLQSLEIYRKNPKTLIVSDVLYRYRINPSSITQTIKLKQFMDELFSRYYSVKLIEELNVWKNVDFDRYFEKSLLVLQWDIRHILLESPSHREAIDNLKQIRMHSFVREYCLDKISNKSSVWLRMFSKERFRTLCILNKLSIIRKSVKGKK